MKDREPAMLWDHGRCLCGETQTTSGHPAPPASHLPEWRAVWPKGTEAKEMALFLGLGKVLIEDGRRAGPIRNKAVALAPGKTGFQGQKPTPPCPEPPRK